MMVRMMRTNEVAVKILFIQEKHLGEALEPSNFV